MNRADLQALAEMRLLDAEVLLREQRWPAAYYLLGYAIECALKTCAAKRFREHEVPDQRIVNSFYTHRLEQLLEVSDLKAQFEARARIDPAFSTNWTTVCEWNEDARYNPLITDVEARGLHAAVIDLHFGVLPWLKTLW